MSALFYENYLELVQLTQLFFLQNYVKDPLPKLASPAKSTPTPPPIEKPLIAKIETPPQPEIKLEPLIEKKVPSLPKIKQESDLGDIHDLLKQHCPALKLIDPPSPFPQVIILYAQENAQEKTLLQDMAKAIRKQGFSIELVAASQCRPASWPKGATKCIISSKALLLEATSLHPHVKREGPAVLHMNQVPLLVIPDLALLIAEPEKRREIWKKIMALLT